MKREPYTYDPDLARRDAIASHRLAHECGMTEVALKDLLAVRDLLEANQVPTPRPEAVLRQGDAMREHICESGDFNLKWDDGTETTVKGPCKVYSRWPTWEELNATRPSRIKRLGGELKQLQRLAWHKAHPNRKPRMLNGRRRK